MLKAAELLPLDSEVFSNLGNLLNDHGRYLEAESSILRAIKLSPDNAQAYCNYGCNLKDQGRFSEAEDSFKRALTMKPDFAEVHYNLGSIFQEQEQFDLAISSYKRALEIKPEYVNAFNNLGSCLMGKGCLSEAESCFRQALSLNPDFSKAHSNLLFCNCHQENISAVELAAEHRQYGEHIEASLKKDWPQHSNGRERDRCLHIGFVSADLRYHAISNYIEPVFRQLAASPDLALHAYYTFGAEDGTSQRLKSYMKTWHSVARSSDAELAEMIFNDGIDILIDLSGHTALNRLPVFARKPAPLQVSWIGYPGTTGLSTMDYYLTDLFFTPSGQFDGQFTEKLAYLPVAAPFIPLEDAPPVDVLPYSINGYVTFGSFNRPDKLGPEVVAVWSQLLRSLPTARMVLGAIPQDFNTETLIELFDRYGVARERLCFHNRCSMKDYLALYNAVDICLDTFPYNGGTTTNHGLWMGVPTLTLAGSTVPSRVGAAVLGHQGLEDFIASDASDFVLKGIAVAGMIPELGTLRADLRNRCENAPSRQSGVVAAGVERALRIMWQRWCAGEPAESFEVSLQDLER